MEQGIVFIQVEYKVQTHPFDWSILFYEYFVKFPQQTNNYASQFYIMPSLNNLSFFEGKKESQEERHLIMNSVQGFLTLLKLWRKLGVAFFQFHLDDPNIFWLRRVAFSFLTQCFFSPHNWLDIFNFRAVFAPGQSNVLQHIKVILVFWGCKNNI